MIWWVAAAILAIVILHLVFPKAYHWPSYDATLGRIPGPPTVPYFGTKCVIATPNDNLLPLIVSTINEYGPVARLNVLGNYSILVTQVTDIEQIMNSKSHITKSVDYDLLHPWLGTGLLTSTGDKWFSHRRLLTPAFHFGILEQYLEIFHNNAQILVENIKSHGSRPVNINKLISMCTLDIVCETAMGTVVNAQKGGESEYVKAVLEMSRLFQYRQLSPWLYNPLTFALSPTGRLQKKTLNLLHGFTEKVISQRQKSFRAFAKSKNQTKSENQEYGGKVRKSFLDLLVEISEADGKLTQEEIREEVDTFMFEGHDTTSAAISWVLFELGLNPDIQRRVQEELDGIFGGSDREATNADIAEMKYLERVIKETLRLYPSVPLIARTIRKLPSNWVCGYDIPVNTSVAIPIFYIHRNTTLYPNPDKFDPDRFLPDKIAKRHPFSYIPFSAGPRNCIGQKFAMTEEKVVLSQVLRQMNVTSLTTRDDIHFMAELVLRPKHNIQLTFAPRQ